MDTDKLVLGSGYPTQPDLVANPDVLPRMDPAVLVGLAIRFGVMGRVSRQGVPPAVREGLRHYADSGEAACSMVLTWLDDLLLADIEEATKSSRLSR